MDLKMDSCPGGCGDGDCSFCGATAILTDEDGLRLVLLAAAAIADALDGIGDDDFDNDVSVADETAAEPSLELGELGGGAFEVSALDAAAKDGDAAAGVLGAGLVDVAAAMVEVAGSTFSDVGATDAVFVEL